MMRRSTFSTVTSPIKGEIIDSLVRSNLGVGVSSFEEVMVWVCEGARQVGVFASIQIQAGNAASDT
jgi:hypothetical protein